MTDIDATSAGVTGGFATALARLGREPLPEEMKAFTEFTRQHWDV